MIENVGYLHSQAETESFELEALEQAAVHHPHRRTVNDAAAACAEHAGRGGQPERRDVKPLTDRLRAGIRIRYAIRPVGHRRRRPAVGEGDALKIRRLPEWSLILSVLQCPRSADRPSPYQAAGTSGTLQDGQNRSEEHTSELQSRPHLVCRLLLE